MNFDILNRLGVDHECAEQTDGRTEKLHLAIARRALTITHCHLRPPVQTIVHGFNYEANNAPLKIPNFNKIKQCIAE